MKGIRDMQMQVSQYGNSLAIRIPKPLARDLGLAKGSRVDLTIRDGRIIIELMQVQGKVTGTPPDKLLQFVGRLPKENFDELEKIIAEGCEKVDEEGW